ncbi:hypothetical protein HMPREF1580_00872 [Gardnerella vaginalis JCP8070]|nr:hypothetical protein HMPREF1580_00872 [Gardnerella vaginalis JCP8070]
MPEIIKIWLIELIKACKKPNANWRKACKKHTKRPLRALHTKAFIIYIASTRPALFSAKHSQIA